jgi:outer membrane protein insertion porin family
MKRLLCIILVYLLAGPVPGANLFAQEADAPLGKITQIRFTGLHTKEEALVADIATLQVGDTLTRNKLENSINDLRKWGIFSKVEVLVAYTDGGGVELTYDLAEGYIIKDIRFRGNFPVLENKVKRAMFLNPGVIYDSEKLPEQVDRLDRLYEDNGYFGTTVLAIEDYNEETHEVTLHFRIKKGTTYRLRKVTAEGNTAVSEKKIRSIILSFFHFKPKSLKNDLQNITELFKDKGFVRARIRVGDEIFDYDARKVDVGVLVRQGPRVKVEFEGNDHFRNKTLRKHITIYEDGDFDEFELDASVKKLKQFYQERGFEEVQVSWDKKRLNKDYHLVIFEIQEAKQRRVASIEFNGNTNIESGKLRDLIVTKTEGLFRQGYFYQKLFEQDLQSIVEYYRQEGYLNAEVVRWEKTYSPLGDKVYLTVEIQEKPRASVKSMTLAGLPPGPREDVQTKLLLQSGAFYSPERLKDDVQIILVGLANHGYPYAEVNQDAAEVEPQRFEISYQVIPGKQVTIKRVLFVGNSKTKEAVLRKNMRIREGDAFSTEKILQSQINIRGLGIFDAVGIETLGLTGLQDEVHLVVRVQEKKDNIIDLEAGYSTDLGISGTLIFNKLNIWGSGKNFNTKIQAGTEINRLELNYVDPRLMGKNLQLTIGAFGGIENQPFFTSKNVGTFASLFKSFGQALSAYGRIDFGYFDVNTTNTVFDSINPSGVPNDRTRLATTLGVTYDTRDNFGDPRSGAYLNSTASMTDQFIQIGGNYATLRANMGYWYSPIRRVTFANALRVAEILKLPSDTNVPADNRLYLGGDTTVRGFEQDSLLPSGGTFSLVYNLELQFRVFKNIMVVGFLDTGVVTNGIDQVNTTTLRHSGGPGIRYLTPVGPIRVDWGFILDPEPTDEGTNRVHFSFGYFF